MNGHKLSGTRQWNRHWQSAGGFIPPVPVYDDFGDYNANVIGIQFGTIDASNPSRYDINYGDPDSFLIFLNENKIFFNHLTFSFTGILPKLIIPKHFEFQLKNKVYFNSDDLYQQYPTGFHHITMRTVNITLYGEDVEFYELTLSDYQNYNFDEYYIDYDCSRGTKNVFNFDAYPISVVTDVASTYLFDTWKFKGRPTRPTPTTHLSNIRFDENVNNLLVKFNNNNPMCGMWNPPLAIYSNDVTYDLNDLYLNTGAFNFSFAGAEIWSRSNAFTMDGICTPTNYTNMYIGSYLSLPTYVSPDYLIQYDGIDVRDLYYFSAFVVEPNADYVFTHMTIESTY